MGGKLAARGSRFLHFVRHGQYIERPGVFGGVLTSLGRRQARRTATRLAELPLALARASDMNRAQETARLILERLPAPPRLVTSARLREGLITAYPGLRVPLDERADAKRRLAELVATLFRPARQDRHELVVAHGNLIRALVCTVLGVRLTAWRDLGTTHCGVTSFVVRPTGRVAVWCYNDAGHLPLALRTAR